MLTRSSQIGEFYIMGPPQNKPDAASSKGCCDIIIFDEEADRHIRIKYHDALRATLLALPGGGAFLGTGTITTLGAYAAGSTITTEWATAAEAWALVNAGVKDDGTTNDDTEQKDALDAAYKKSHEDNNGRDKPYIVISRPFIEHMMHSAVVAVAGRDTGATLFGPADMQISANTQVKTIEG